jgi:protein SCO1/2
MTQTRTIRYVASLGALVLALAGCSNASSHTVSSATLPTTGVAVGTLLDKPLDAAVLDLPLTDEHGTTFTLRSLAGKTVVLTDFLTTCQEVCPMTSVNMRDAAKATAAAGLGDSVRFLEVTVDPKRDDATRLAAYQKLFGAQPNWDFATAGTAGTVTLWKSLGVSYSEVASDTPPPRDWLTNKPLTYDVNHQDVVFVIDGSGHERWLVDASPATGGEQPPAALAHFLNDEGRSNLANPPEPSWTATDVETAIGAVTGTPIG